MDLFPNNRLVYCKKKKKTILIVTDNLKDQVNGVVTTYRNMEREAIRDDYKMVYLDPSQFFYIDCPPYPEVKISWPYGIQEKILAIRPDYIHIATEGTLGLAVRLYCLFYGLQFNTSYHTKHPQFMRHLFGIPEWITYAYMRWFHHHPGKVLTTTRSMLRELLEKGKFVNNFTEVWTRGVNRDALCSTVEYRPPSQGVKPTLLSVGRVSKEKTLEDLCRLQDDYRVQIVGDGPDRARLEEIYPRVCFLGYKKGTELANAYRTADVFVFPSRCDVFGVVIIEALSQGCPVAAYPVGGPIDILETGVTGYMEEDLVVAITKCLTLDRTTIEQASKKWTWSECWRIFRDNMTPVIPPHVGISKECSLWSCDQSVRSSQKDDGHYESRGEVTTGRDNRDS
jgi:glycosyltransferase involved in cell wall biosynthesis